MSTTKPVVQIINKTLRDADRRIATLADSMKRHATRGVAIPDVVISQLGESLQAVQLLRNALEPFRAAGMLAKPRPAPKPQAKKAANKAAKKAQPAKAKAVEPAKVEPAAAEQPEEKSEISIADMKQPAPAQAALSLGVGMGPTAEPKKNGKHVRSDDARKPAVVAALKKASGGSRVTLVTEIGENTFQGNCLVTAADGKFTNLGFYQVVMA